MADDERLVVLLEARIRDFEKNMAKASGTADKSYDRMRRGSRSATRNMERDMVRSTGRINHALASTSTRIGALGRATGFSALGASAAAAVGPVVLMGAALSKARDAISDFDKIAKSAKATGLNSDFYQELAYGADLAGVSTEELNASMIAFIRNSGLAAVGQGELAGKLKELNPELLKQLQTAKTQEERMRLVADAVKEATSETEKAAIASAAFGRNGAKMVELLKDGAEGFDKTAAAAKELGIIIDRDLLTRAEEMNDQLSTASRIMDAELKKALIDLAPFLVSTARLAAGVAAEFAKVVDSMRDLENQSTRGLNNQLAELGLERLEIERQILEAQDRQRGNTSVLAGAEARLDTGVLALKARAEEIAKAEAEILAILSSRRDGAVTPSPVATTTSTSGAGGKGSSGRNTAAEAALREAEAVRTLIIDLHNERAEIGMTDIERAKSQALRQAGAAATEDQKLAIVDLIQAIHDETEAQREAAEVAEFFHDIALDGFDQLIPKIRTGNDALDQFVNTLVKAVAQAALLGKGPLASLFGGGGGFLSGLLGGGPSFKPNTTFGSFIGLPSMDGGGYTGSGSRSGGLDGKGGFMALLHPKETVLDHTRGQGSISQLVTVNQTFQISGAVSSEDIKAAIRQQAAATKQEIEGKFAKTYEKNNRVGNL